MEPKVIALYLPQFYPTPTNNKWWGIGHTEWRSVGKAKKLFPGHYQPRIPADLGYYDLRIPEVREKQVELAKKAGIYGFCYYHYWFGNGHEELELPFNEIVKSGKPDFPFMLCWANESWEKKFWDQNVKIQDGKNSIILQQTYPGKEDHINHFYHFLPAFKDKRYIKINGRLAFMIYKPDDLPETSNFINLWQYLATTEGLPEFHFIAHVSSYIDKPKLNEYLKKGFKGVNTVGLGGARAKLENKFLRKTLQIYARKFYLPFNIEYKDIYPLFKTPVDNEKNVYPSLIPNWDHTPRSGKYGFLIHNSTPNYWREHIKDFFKIIKSKNENIIFLKSWNEWGEGNYMEPDLKWGHQYIDILREEIDNFKDNIS